MRVQFGVCCCAGKINSRISYLAPVFQWDTYLDVMIYFHNEVAQLTLHPAEEYVHLHWYASVREDADGQYIMSQVLDALQTYRWQKLLASQQEASPFPVELQVWLQLDWRPRAVQASYQYCALVLPHDLASQMVIADIMRDHTATWPLYYRCSTEQEARVWLAEQPHVA
jgi:hypothetical protein